MQFKALGAKYFLRLVKGEEIVETLTSFCQSQNIQFGTISGIGGASQVTLGYYNLEEKAYHWQDFSGHLELTSLTGNVALLNNEPFLHVHTVISNQTFQCFGGHLKEGMVGGTLELVIEKMEGPVERTLDEETGLKLLNLQ